MQREILEFCDSRWVAIHCIDKSGKLVFRRYLDGKPITLRSTDEMERFLESEESRLRSIYATANIYGVLRSAGDVYNPDNIIFCTPTWDVDGDISEWRETVKAAKKITDFLREEGLERSVYVKWSGNGCHVHVHERAFSKSLIGKYHPLDLAYSMVEYVRRKLRFLDGGINLNMKVKVENRMDFSRVFTCPLSFHRRLNVVCICMKPEDLDRFNPRWIHPGCFKHNHEWREYSEGEADGLAVEAYRAVGGYPSAGGRKRKNMPLDKQIIKWLRRW